MTDYEPLDLSPYCNAGKAELNVGDPRLGHQTLRGLPFIVAEDPERFCITPEGSPVRIDVSRPARHVIFAHRQLAAPAGDVLGLGSQVAQYRFHLAGGPTVSVPVRQRFEIAIVPQGWGLLPYLAFPDHADGLYPRLEGPFASAGFRQCESTQGNAEEYFLWAWPNPHPELTLDAIELVPSGQPFAVGAITLGQAEEPPFVRAAARPVVITIDGDGQSDNLEVEVDRGVAGYVQPVPAEDDDAVAGWGRRSTGRSYVQVASLPSATLTVNKDGQEIARVRWAEVETGQPVASGPARVQLADPGRNWAHVRVLDAGTGRPVPCRVHFRHPLGVPFQPHGHHNHVNSNMGTWHIDVGGDVRLGDVTYAYIDGTCQGWLPRGDVLVDVTRGFEYTPLHERVHIEPGQRELTLQISRWTDMAASGWYSGDSHVHFLSTQGAHLEQQCEDLRVVNLLQSQWGSLFTNTEEFTGRVSTTPDGGFATYVGQENRQHFLGHLTLWGLKEPVMPWCTDGPHEGELGGSLESTLADWADRAHAQGGTVIIPHFPVPNGEPAVLATTGRTDAIESLRWDPNLGDIYYRYLNAGYKLPLVGGTDKMSSGVPVGLYRTYAHLDEEFSYPAWCAAVRAGRTFLSGGPIIQLTVDGHAIGGTVELSGPGTVHVEASAESIFPLSSLEIVVQGRVVASTERAEGPRSRLALSVPVQVAGHSWVAARCRGAGGNHLDEWERPVFAHTSPVYVAVGGAWEPRDREAGRYLTTLVEGGLEYVRHTATYHRAGMVTHHHGGDDHAAYIERPFLEALAALKARYPSV
ncbi:MAG TPA: CehA/McbA family metallohydrolase [Acidimicrobiales bacterium]|nr:CehA/McbA family metallohydrolase [Acidimicrobiales bacterium]